MAASSTRQAFKPNEYATYFAFFHKLYGPLVSYKRMEYGLTGHPQLGEVLQVAYSCQFKYCKGAMMMSLSKDGKAFRLFDISIRVEDFTPIVELRKFGDPVMKLMQSGDFKGIYNMSSSKMRQAYTEDQFTSSGKSFTEMGAMTEYQLYQHQIFMYQGQLFCALVYAAKIKGQDIPIELTFSKTGDKFVLEGLNTAGGGQDPNAPPQ